MSISAAQLYHGCRQNMNRISICLAPVNNLTFFVAWVISNKKLTRDFLTLVIIFADNGDLVAFFFQVHYKSTKLHEWVFVLC